MWQTGLDYSKQERTSEECKQSGLQRREKSDEDEEEGEGDREREDENDEPEEVEVNLQAVTL